MHTSNSSALFQQHHSKTATRTDRKTDTDIDTNVHNTAVVQKRKDAHFMRISLSTLYYTYFYINMRFIKQIHNSSTKSHLILNIMVQELGFVQYCIVLQPQSIM
uniref:Ovule protein n=1 Tax=Ascaris lumbricoides TaxID=6252 RepID=A0A0M3HQW4_ASCLU